jgi:glutathione synthase/RimK-type ligase-like ATP-grasp enzyme
MAIDTLLFQALTHAREGQLDLAEPLLWQILAVEPQHPIAGLELARALILGNRFDAAIGVLDPLTLAPHCDAEVHRRLALAHSFADRKSVAIQHYRCALELEPGDGKVLHSIANLEQALGLADQAALTFRQAVQAQPLWTMPALVSPPQFRVLWMFAPGAGNTPPDYFIANAHFESHIFTVLNEIEYDIELLRRHTDVIVNLVSDVDRSRAILGTVAALVQRIGKPVINPPRSIFGTDRASVAARLAGTPGCIVPHTRTFSKAQLRQAAGTREAAPLTFPLLVRPAGTHGGDDFDKLDDRAQLDAFLNCPGDSLYYATPFIDYRSADGYFRKYRFIYVGDEILPYHLAIDDKWKVHHASTSMADFPWMQHEEQAFLDDPWRVFGESQHAALRAIRHAIGLDYFGIDCALTGAGELVVFEVNATMRVHGKNECFAYKDHAVARIKLAFHSLLERAAHGAAIP